MLLFTLVSAAVAIRHSFDVPPPAVGDWVHPAVGDARSPCPALNTMANHGYFPRNGRNIPMQTFVDALKDNYNVSPGLTSTIVNGATSLNLRNLDNSTFDLDTLGIHGRIEHDVSLVHNDANIGSAYAINQTLLQQFLDTSSDGRVLSLGDIKRFRSARLADSRANNPALEFTTKQKVVALGEAAVFFSVFSRRK